MSLRRTELRQDLVTRLIAAATAAGARVFESRTEPLRNEELPAIVVKTPDERATRAKGGGIRFDSVVTLQVEIHVMGLNTKAAADAIDAINEEIELKVLNDPAWNKLFDSFDGYDAQMDFNSESDKARGTCILILDLKTQKTFPPLVVDTFTSAHISVDAVDPSDPNKATSGPDGVFEVVAPVTIPQ